MTHTLPSPASLLFSLCLITTVSCAPINSLFFAGGSGRAQSFFGRGEHLFVANFTGLSNTAGAHPHPPTSILAYYYIKPIKHSKCLYQPLYAAPLLFLSFVRTVGALFPFPFLPFPAYFNSY